MSSAQTCRALISHTTVYVVYLVLLLLRTEVIDITVLPHKEKWFVSHNADSMGWLVLSNFYLPKSTW